jgi:cytochrome b subunit of formate dehydrogenase
MIAGAISASGAAVAAEDRVVRHPLRERVFHWSMAALIVTLSVSAFAPVIGWKFDWIPIHWISGVLFSLMIAGYIVGAAKGFDARAMIVDRTDIRNMFGTMALTFGRGTAAPKPGKYPLMQKLFYWGMVVWIPALIVTGLLMLAKLDTPFWHRNPYWLSDFTWGVIYTLHGFLAVTMLGLVMMHVYFAIRPEKLYLLRSMIVGWITRSEYVENFDQTRWHPEPVRMNGENANGDRFDRK